MKTLIIGGGKIGFYLVKTLLERKQDVILVERNKSLCQKISEELNIDVIWGDGTDLEVLKDAEIMNADIVVAATGNDEENLIICQIAKLCFHTEKTISRVNNPKNREIFKELGIDNTVCSTEVIANLIEFSLEHENYKVINVLEKGLMVLAELYINQGNAWTGHTIRDLDIPSECVLVSVIREERVIYPRGDTEIQVHDKVIIITNKDTLKLIARNIFPRGGIR